jgi:phospholipase A1/A2
MLLSAMTSSLLFSYESPQGPTLTNPTLCNCDLQVKEEDEYKLTRNKDIYFILGIPDTKVQISFKYKPMSNFNLFLGYTQLMLWELNKPSLPFKDVNYNPEIFYRIQFPKHTFVKSIDLGLFEHKSNGRDGDASRAWSGSYVKLNTVVRFYKWTFNWDIKTFIFYNFSIDDTNWDIRDYTGFWSMRVYFVNFYESEHFVDRLEMYLAFNNGGRFSQTFSKASEELGLKIRMGWGKVYPYLFFQLFHGYNEALLEYNKEYVAYRVGFAF